MDIDSPPLRHQVSKREKTSYRKSKIAKEKRKSSKWSKKFVYLERKRLVPQREEELEAEEEAEEERQERERMERELDEYWSDNPEDSYECTRRGCVDEEWLFWRYR